MKVAKIEVQTHSLPLNRHYDTYRWVGHSWLPVEVDWGVSVSDLPWPLEKIEDLPHRASCLYVRRDRFPLALKVWVTARNAWAWVDSRLAMTLVIWGLAQQDKRFPCYLRNLRRRRSKP